MLANVFYFIHKKATVSKDKPKNEEEMLLEGSQKNENEMSLKLDDDWTFLGENANLSDFNPDEVFSSSSDVAEGLNMAKDDEDDNQNINDEAMVDTFGSYTSQSSSKNHK